MFTSNYYKVTINNSYLTDKDFAGNVISSKSRFFLVIDASIYNMANDRSFDSSKLSLYIDDKYYVPTVRYNKRFQDLGNTFVKDDVIYKDRMKVYSFYKKIMDNYLAKGGDLYNGIQILAPMYAGVSGIDEINRMIQDIYNHDEEKFIIRDTMI